MSCRQTERRSSTCLRVCLLPWQKGHLQVGPLIYYCQICPLTHHEDLSVRQAELSTEVHKRAKRLTYLVNAGDMAARRPALAYAPCIPASPCPQLAPSPALAYPPTSALRVSFGICFGWHLAISFSRCFPSSIWSSFPTTFPAQSTAVLGQGVATKCVPVQLHLRILPHHDH